MGLKFGFGIMIIDGMLKYKGKWENNYPHGDGEMNFQNGDKYKG